MKTWDILFLCTHNSARSILGEALASTDPGKKFVGYSAGSTPGTRVNPFAAEIAGKLDYPARPSGHGPLGFSGSVASDGQR